MSSREKVLLHALIVSSYATFFGGMLLSAARYYAGKPIDLDDALISYLLSAHDNPRGSRIAIVGIALCGFLLLPVVFLFYRALARRGPRMALAGSLIFALGPLCAIAMIFFTSEINDVHVGLAYAAYIFMTAGLLISLALEGSATIKAGGVKGVAMLMVLLFLAATLVFLFTREEYLADKGIFRNVALCEWALCVVIACSMSGLAMMLTRPTR
jgi:hypothetical protein